MANDRVFNPPTACMSASVRQLRRCCCVRSAVWCPLAVPDIVPCPWACLVSCVSQSSLDTIAATHGPRHLQEITGAIDRSMNSLQDIMDMHHSVHKVTQH